MAILFPSRSVKGTTITHTFLNQYLRDNLNGLHWSGAYQTADLVRNANTTLADCTGLTIPVASGDVWAFIAHSFFISNATADAKWTITAPGSSTGRFGLLTGGVGLGDLSSTTFGAGLAVAVPGVLEDNAFLFGHVTAGGAGSITVQAAQNTSTAIDTTFRTYSPIVGFRIAGPTASPIPTFSNNQVLSAANLNTYLRDEFENLRLQHAYMPGIVEALNTAAAQDLTNLRFRVREGEEWIWFSMIGFDSTGAAGLALRADAPFGSVGRFGIAGDGGPVGAGSVSVFGSTFARMAVSNTNNRVCMLNGTIIAGRDGYVQLQGAQETATPGVTTTFHQDSFLVAFRVGE